MGRVCGWPSDLTASLEVICAKKCVIRSEQRSREGVCKESGHPPSPRGPQPHLSDTLILFEPQVFCVSSEGQHVAHRIERAQDLLSMCEALTDGVTGGVLCERQGLERV